MAWGVRAGVGVLLLVISGLLYYAHRDPTLLGGLVPYAWTSFWGVLLMVGVLLLAASLR